MSTDMPLQVVLCWHMHQPDYRDPLTRDYHAPWVYLHAIKDYTDMAYHLEQHPSVAAVVNFSPVLLEQLEDLAERLQAHVQHGHRIGVALLDALAAPVLVCDEEQRRMLAAACLKANERHLIERFQPYRKLAELARSVLSSGDGFHYLDDHFIFDLLMWFHLAWLGESVRRHDKRAARLMDKGTQYSYADRCVLLEVIADLMIQLPLRYAKLGDAQAELSVSPWGHPILPLLLSFDSAQAAQPDSVLPVERDYPGGEERVRWHLEHALMVFQRVFKRTPQGCWPSEGAICTRSLALIEAAGFNWAASGQQVLSHSLAAGHLDSADLHRPYRQAAGRQAAGGLNIFFRDDGLSDLIGFTYKEWHGDDAAQDFIRHLENIRGEAGDGRVVSVILDGENAWEYYPSNGYYFLRALYTLLAENPHVQTTTFSRCLRDPEVEHAVLPRVVAGSWVYGDLATWIGHAEKNHAWALLVAAKQCFDRKAGGAAAGAALLQQLAVCEASDWFWWPGEYNPSEAVSLFGCLYRQQLAGLYRLLNEMPPEALAHSFSFGGGHPEAGGTMRPGH